METSGEFKGKNCEIPLLYKSTLSRRHICIYSTTRFLSPRTHTRRNIREETRPMYVSLYVISLEELNSAAPALFTRLPVYACIRTCYYMNECSSVKRHSDFKYSWLSFFLGRRDRIKVLLGWKISNQHSFLCLSNALVFFATISRFT